MVSIFCKNCPTCQRVGKKTTSRMRGSVMSTLGPSMQNPVGAHWYLDLADLRRIKTENGTCWVCLGGEAVSGAVIVAQGMKDKTSQSTFSAITPAVGLLGDPDIMTVDGGKEWKGDFVEGLKQLCPGTLVIPTRARNPKVIARILFPLVRTVPFILPVLRPCIRRILRRPL